jgi:hypothetical protein
MVNEYKHANHQIHCLSQKTDLQMVDFPQIKSLFGSADAE